MEAARKNAPKYGWEEPDNYDYYCSENGYDDMDDETIPEDWSIIEVHLQVPVGHHV